MARTHRSFPLALLGLAAAAAAQWTQVTPTTSPPARIAPAMAFDGTFTVLFGGIDTATFPPVNFADTWTWDGLAWTQRSPANAPAGRNFAGMAHDVVRGRTVLYGGRTTTAISSTYRNDTWEWDGATWTQITTANTPGSIFSSNGVSEVSMAYDLVGQRVVLFGGELFQGIVPAPALTLEYDGTNWTQVSTTAAPPRRSQAAMCSAPTLAGVLLFGGTNFNNPPGPNGEITWNDTWVYSALNDAWTQLQPVGALPPPRAGASILYDANLGLYVMHGGYVASQSSTTPLNDTWTFDGTTWTDVTVPFGAPPARVRFGASESPGNLHVMFGGAASFTAAANAETWVQGSIAEAMPYGAGCQGSNGTPILTAGSRPVLGTTWNLDYANLPIASAFAFLTCGFSDTTSPAGPLPLSLAPYGLSPSCFLLGSAEAATLVPVTGAAGSTPIYLGPANPAFAGLVYYYQYGSIDAVVPGGFAVTNGVRVRFGLY